MSLKMYQEIKTLQDKNYVYTKVIIFKILLNNSQNITVNVFKNIIKIILHYCLTQNVCNRCVSNDNKIITVNISLFSNNREHVEHYYYFCFLKKKNY